MQTLMGSYYGYDLYWVENPGVTLVDPCYYRYDITADEVFVVGTETKDKFVGENYYDVKIKAGAGDDFIGPGAGWEIYGDSGNDVIYGMWINGLTVYGGTEDDEIHGKDDCFLDGGFGNDSIYGSANSEINGGEGNDKIAAWDGSYVFGGSGNDFISGRYNNGTVEGGNGSDTIETGHSEKAMLAGGAGDDVIIFNSGADSMILGDEGDDTIYCNFQDSVYSGRLVATIEGGEGNDVIVLSQRDGTTESVMIEYYEGDGHDVVYGASSKLDKVHIEAPYNMTYTQTSEQASKDLADLIFLMTDGSITFKDLSVSEYLKHPLEVIGDVGGRPLDFVYTGGNKAVSQYTGGKVAWNTDCTGIGFNSTDFMINSSSGTLTLQNVRDKVIDVSNTRGKSIAYAYMASGGGEIDGRRFSQLEVVLGGDYAENVISAGAGGSSLWGGAGNVSDTLNGGGGVDYFFIGKNDGSDLVKYASQEDQVMLYDVSLNDISYFTTVNEDICLGFNTDSNIRIRGTDEISPTFQLENGSRWKYDHSTKEWQSA